MDFAFLALLAIPIIWLIIAKNIWPIKLTIREMAVQAVAVTLMTTVVWIGGQHIGMSYTEVINGEITDKKRVRVSCSHSYECMCSTDSKGNRTCSTCYEHSNDYDWRVYTNLDRSFNIRRVNRQGTYEPKRFTAVKMGEPVALPNSYINYVRAASDSLFHDEASELDGYADMIPDYPLSFYDYHHINRVLVVGDIDIDTNAWSAQLSDTLKELGPEKQANVVLVFVENAGPAFATALKRSWEGGNKNDIVVTVGVTQEQIMWTNVFSWAQSDIFNVVLRDELMELKELDATMVMNIIRNTTMEHFERKPMADFEYLKDDIDPPLWLIILAAAFAIISSASFTYYFKENN